MGKFYSPSEWIRRILSRTRSSDGRYLDDHYRDLGERRAIADQAFSLSRRTASDRVAYEEDVKAIRHRAIEIRQTGLSILLQQLKSGRYVAAASYDPFEAKAIIPKSYWPFLTLDVDTGIAKSDAETFRGVEIADTSDLDDNARQQLATASEKTYRRLLERHAARTPGHPAAGSAAVEGAVKPASSENVPESVRDKRMPAEDAGESAGSAQQPKIKAYTRVQNWWRVLPPEQKALTGQRGGKSQLIHECQRAFPDLIPETVARTLRQVWSDGGLQTGKAENRKGFPELPA